MLADRKQYCHLLTRGSLALSLFILFCFIASNLGYRINSTPSLPQGLWKIETLTGPVNRGQVANVRPVDSAIFKMALSRHYLTWGLYSGGYASLLKPVAAIPGDQIAISSQGIAVNSVLLPNSKALTMDSAGRHLHSMKAGKYTVQPGTVWLVSSCTQSFDSRYFGPLPIANILGIANPIWVGGFIQ